MTDQPESPESRPDRVTSDLYDLHINRTGRLLRQLADTVERDGRVRRPGPMAHVLAAQNVVHEVVWGTANLNLGGLISFAADADQAALAGRVADAEAEASAWRAAIEELRAEAATKGDGGHLVLMAFCDEVESRQRTRRTTQPLTPST